MLYLRLDSQNYISVPANQENNYTIQRLIENSGNLEYAISFSGSHTGDLFFDNLQLNIQ